MKIKIVKILFSFDIFTLGFWREAVENEFGRENLVFFFLEWQPKLFARARGYVSSIRYKYSI